MPSEAPAARRARRPATPGRRYAAALTHVAAALPATAVPNASVADRLGVEPGWIESRTGIAERRRLAPGETLVDLAARAAADLLGAAELEPAAVDLVLVATTTTDDVLPNAAPLVARAIGATRAGAFDVGAACTGFVAGLSSGAAQVEAGRAQTVLLVGADALSRFTDPGDRRTAALFGDGAGAVLIGRAAAGGASRIGPVVLGADGGGADLLRITRSRGVVEMEGQEVFRHAVARMAEATLAACEHAGAALGDIELFVYHQANARILRALAQRLGLDPDRVVDDIGAHGNTSAASIPLALHGARSAGRLEDGTRVLLAAFGAGFAWGGAVVEWGASG